MLRAGDLDRSDFDEAWAAWIEPEQEHLTVLHPQPFPRLSVNTLPTPLAAASSIQTDKYDSPHQPVSQRLLAPPYEPLLRILLALAATLATSAWLHSNSNPLAHGCSSLLIGLQLGTLSLSGAILASSPRPFLLFGLACIAQAFLIAENLSRILDFHHPQVWMATLVVLGSHWLALRFARLFDRRKRPMAAYQWQSAEWIFLILMVGLVLQTTLAPLSPSLAKLSSFQHFHFREAICRWSPLVLTLFVDGLLAFGQTPRSSMSLPRTSLRLACLTLAWWWALTSLSPMAPSSSSHVLLVCLAFVSSLPSLALSWMDNILRQPLTTPSATQSL